MRKLIVNFLVGTALVEMILPLSGCSKSVRTSRFIEQADQYYKSGNYDKAKIQYLNALRLDHQNVRAFEQLGLIWSEQGVPLRAIPFLLKVRELAPKHTPARDKLALALMALGDRTEARKEAKAILEQDPKNSDAIILIADTAQGKEDFAATEEYLKKFPDKQTAAYHLAGASLAVKKGEIGAASDEVQQAIAAEPKSARAHLVLGFLYLLRKDKARAGEELKTAADLAPLRSDERIKYAEFQAADGNREEAKRVLGEITKAAPDYLPAWRDLAQIALTEKKYDEALTFLENMIGRDPDNPEARLLQSSVFLANGEGHKAVASLDRLNANYPKNPLIKLQIAKAYVQTRNLSQASLALEQALKARPDFAEAILALAELNLRTGKAQAVVAPMEDLLKKHPEMSQARVLLADAYRGLGKLDKAAELFREQIKAKPDSGDSYLLLGLILRQQKKEEEARQAFEKAGELAPDNLLPIDQLIDMDLRQKQFDNAEQRVQQLFQKIPDFPPAHVLQGKIFAAQGKWDAAEAEFKKTIELKPDYAPAYDLLIQVYLISKRVPQAIDELQKLASKQPKDPRPLMLLGHLYDRTNDFPKARETYERVLALNPDSVFALNNLAYIYAGPLNDLAKGHELATKARSLQPNEPSVADTLGWILYKKGEFQQALALLQESVSKQPDNGEMQFHLGMTYYMMGQSDAARAALERAVQVTGDYPGKDEAQRRLAALQQSGTQRTTTELEADLKQQPDDPLGLMRLGEDYEKQDKAAEAAVAFEKAYQLNPKLPGLALKLAQLYAGPLHKSDKALEMAKKARDLAPNDATVAGTLGAVVLKAGNYQWAYTLLKESARLSANDPGVLRDLAWAAYYCGKVSEARQMMRKLQTAADSGSSDQKEAEQFLGLTSIEEGPTRLLAVEDQIDPVLQARPDYLPALMAHAALQIKQGNIDAAIKSYNEILGRYPDFAPAQRDLATLYAASPGSLDKAKELATRARKSLPEDSRLARLLGQVNFQSQQYNNAIQFFKESARKTPLDAASLYQLGIAEIETAKTADGIEHLRRAVAGGLDGALAADAQRRMAAAEQKKVNSRV